MNNGKLPQSISVNECRQQLIQTLSSILSRERQWLAQMESLPDESIKPLTDYLTEHISILGDTVAALASGRYRLLSVSEAICKDIASTIEFAMASHFRACEHLNSGLVAKGILAVRLQPIVL